MSGINGLQHAPALPYSDKEATTNPFADPSIREFYGGQSSHNRSHEMSATEDKRSDAEVEKEILDEYSYEVGNPASSIKTSAFSLNRGCKVMIKRYSKAEPMDIARANREITALQAISDTAVPPLLDYFDPADTIFTVVEDREDESLRRYIEGRGTLSEDMLKATMTQLFSAIANIFFAGFAHLRINNETLFIDKSGQLTIKDFEYAHPYVNEKVDDLYASVDVKYGSDIYVAPEVFTTVPYNARKAVMWSCGVVLYYMATGQTERLSNLEHPVFSKPADAPLPTPIEEQPTQRRRSSLGFRRQSLASRKSSISQPISVISYPGNRFEVTGWVRDIISKMLITNPLRRPELIEVAAKVPKEFHTKITRPLMEVAWNDYKIHAGPHAGLDEQFELESSSSSIYSGISNFSNPFGSLLGGRRNSGKNTAYADYA